MIKLREDQTVILNQSLAGLEAKGEHILIPATPCNIRLGIATRPSGRIALTTARVIWQWRQESGEIPVVEINNVSESAAYNGESLYGVSWIVLSYSNKEIGIGFATGGQNIWLEQLKKKIK